MSGFYAIQVFDDRNQPGNVFQIQAWYYGDDSAEDHTSELISLSRQALVKLRDDITDLLNQEKNDARDTTPADSDKDEEEKTGHGHTTPEACTGTAGIDPHSEDFRPRFMGRRRRG